MGYETYGTLNRERSNVILVCHYFSATSHAAGKYTVHDEEFGWWDGLIHLEKQLIQISILLYVRIIFVMCRRGIHM